MVPELSAAALKSNHDKELALWYELRAININGSGVLVVHKALAALVKHFAYSRRTAYRLLRLGDGRFWQLEKALVHGREVLPARVRLRSLESVAEYLGVKRLSHFIDMSIAEVKDRAHRRAHLYASFFKPENARANPISRNSIEAATGVKRRQQRRYEVIAGVKRVANFAFEQRNGKLVPMIDIVCGKDQEYAIVRRLGNSYHSQVSWPCRGMTKRVNARLKERSLEVQASIPRRFFLKAQSVIKTPCRAPEAFLLVRERDRLIKGRMEWCLA